MKIFQLLLMTTLASCGTANTESSFLEADTTTVNNVTTTFSNVGVNIEFPSLAWKNYTKKYTSPFFRIEGEKGAKYVAYWESTPVYNYEHCRPGGFCAQLEEPELVGYSQGYRNYPSIDRQIPNYQSKCVFESPVFKTGSRKSKGSIEIEFKGDKASFDLEVIIGNYRKKFPLKANGNGNWIKSFEFPANVSNMQIKICDLNFERIQGLLPPEGRPDGTHSIEFQKATILQIYL